MNSVLRKEASPPTVIIADSNKEIRTMLRLHLEVEHFIVFEACKTQRILEILKEHSVNLILTDDDMHDAHAFNILRLIKEHSNASVVIMTRNAEPAQKAEMFEYGAQEVISKPFDIAELLMRIKTVLGNIKAKENLHPPSPVTRTLCVEFGSHLVLDQDRMDVALQHNGEYAHLSSQEFKLLEYMLSHSHQILSREQLCDSLKNPSYQPTSRAIDIKIMRIRRKIGDTDKNHPIIKTIHGRGYYLNSDVRPLFPETQKEELS